MNRGLNYAVWILGLSVVLSSCTMNSIPIDNKMNNSPQISDPSTSDEEYRIYSQIIDDDKTFAGVKIIINKKTTFGSVKPLPTLEDVVLALKKDAKSSDISDLIDNFALKNKESVELTDKFNIRCCFYEFGNYLDKKRNSPEVIVGFSRIGFDKKGEMALVYFEQYSGPKTAAGKYLVLKKGGDKWTVQNYGLPQWVS